MVPVGLIRPNAVVGERRRRVAPFMQHTNDPKLVFVKLVEDGVWMKGNGSQSARRRRYDVVSDPPQKRIVRCAIHG